MPENSVFTTIIVGGIEVDVVNRLTISLFDPETETELSKTYILQFIQPE